MIVSVPTIMYTNRATTTHSSSGFDLRLLSEVLPVIGSIVAYFLLIISRSIISTCNSHEVILNLTGNLLALQQVQPISSGLAHGRESKQD